MNAILSIFVCIAMLLSGGAALPAQPETATVRTLRNLSVTTDEGSVTLTPEARLTTAIGSEQAIAQFEIVSGDDILLPMTGELTNDGVRFSLSDGGSVYSLSNDAMLELAEMDEEDAQLLALMVDYMNSYSGLLQRSMGDASFQQELSRTMTELLVSACGGETEQVAVEIDGAEVPANRAQLEITSASALDLLDALGSCGISEIEGMMNSYVLLLASAMGEDYASLSDLTADLRAQLTGEGAEDDFSFPMELTWTAEAPAYAAIDVSCDIDETTAIQLSVASTSTDERTDMDMTMGFAVDDGAGSVNEMEFRMTEQVEGPLTAPEKVQLHVEAASQSGWSSEYDEDGIAHSYVYSSAMDLALDVNAAVVSGLEHAVIDLTASQIDSCDYDGDVDIDETGLSAHISSDERSETDGSVTTAVVMDIAIDGENMKVSWELNCAEGMPVPGFDEGRTVDLAEALSEEEGSTGSIALMSDVLRLSADATALCADESVLAMMELLGLNRNTVLDETGYEDIGLITVYSMERAAEIYQGALPDFTVPEDLTLDEIYVSSSSLDAYYSSADGERSINLYCYEYGNSYGEFYSVQDGALVPAGAIISIDALDEEGTAFSAEVSAPTGRYSFCFYGLAREEVEDFLASLQF